MSESRDLIWGMMPFETAAHVEETGLVVVHRGETIVSAPESAARIQPMVSATGTVIEYSFPLEVVVSGSLPEEERRILEASIWTQLQQAIHRLG